MKRVLLDVDGVLSDFVGSWIKLLNAHFDRSWTHADVTHFDVCESLDIPVDQRGDAKRLISEFPNFAATHDVLPGAIEGVFWLQHVADVYIVTSPWNSHPTWTSDREKWLKKYFGIHHDRVVHTSAKHVVSGDILVDDKTSTLDAWQSAHPLGVAVQWRTPHNRRDAWSGVSTCSWDDVIELARERAQ